VKNNSICDTVDFDHLPQWVRRIATSSGLRSWVPSFDRSVTCLKCAHVVQAWLQKFAWTERTLQDRVDRRNVLPQNDRLLEDEPMFCFETAVKLLYWSGFVYEHEEACTTQSYT